MTLPLPERLAGARWPASLNSRALWEQFLETPRLRRRPPRLLGEQRRVNRWPRQGSRVARALRRLLPFELLDRTDVTAVAAIVLPASAVTPHHSILGPDDVPRGW